MRAHRIVAANSAAIRLFRFGTEAAATGRSLDELQVPLRADRTRPTAPSCLFANGPRTDELRLYRDDGATCSSPGSTPLPSRSPADRACSVFVTDVTDQHATRQYLRASERRYRLLLEQASDAIFVSDPDGRYVEVNDAACALLGYGRDELLGLDIGQLVPPEAPCRARRGPWAASPPERPSSGSGPSSGATASPSKPRSAPGSSPTAGSTRSSATSPLAGPRKQNATASPPSSPR